MPEINILYLISYLNNTGEIIRPCFISLVTYNEGETMLPHLIICVAVNTKILII